MSQYTVFWTETTRRKIVLDADGPAEAKEAFWNHYHDLHSVRFPIGIVLDTSEPQKVTVWRDPS